jgi:hypothetical protein
MKYGPTKANLAALHRKSKLTDFDAFTLILKVDNELSAVLDFWT